MNTNKIKLALKEYFKAKEAKKAEIRRHVANYCEGSIKLSAKETIADKIVKILVSAGRPMTVSEIKDCFPSKQGSTINAVLTQLSSSNLITRIARGKYRMKLNKPAALVDSDPFWNWFDDGMQQIERDEQ